MANRNTVYAEIFVDELARAGLQHAVLAPGSRNTALVLAFAKHEAIKTYSQLDERSAAFFALGIAQATGEAAAVVCTSGTAAANFFPAVVEAHQSCIPLLVLTADRPPELRHSGANQTIDQVKMFGDYALWFVDAPLPEADPPPVATRHLRTLAGRALATANGLRKGVVHINLPFRKPLEPTPVAGDQLNLTPNPHPADHPFTLISRGRLLPNEQQISHLTDWIAELPKGLIIAGPNATKGETAVYTRLAQAAGYPLLAEPTSGLRFGGGDVIGAYNTFPLAGELLALDILIQFGEVPTSNPLLTYLGKVQPQHRILITENGEWRDDQHTVTALIHADPAAVCESVTERLPVRDDRRWVEQWQRLEQATWQAVDAAMQNTDDFDGSVIYDLVSLLPEDSSLFTGNSLPIRHLDQFGKPVGKRIHAYANRGASGIDGNISTALGIGAAHPERPLVAVVGDVTFYHDMNGLLAVRRCGVPVTIVLLNNNGGGIFHRLPIKDYDPPFTDYFLTPHDLDFCHAARLYGLDYIRADTRKDFRWAFSACVGSAQATIIEVHTDAQHDFACRSAVMAQVQQHVSEFYTVGDKQ